MSINRFPAYAQSLETFGQPITRSPPPLLVLDESLVDVVAMRHRVPAPVEDEPHEQIPLLVQPHARLVQHLDL